MSEPRTRFVDELEPGQLLEIIRRNLLLIVVCALLGAAGGFVLTKLRLRYYETSVLLQVMRPLVATAEGDIQLDDQVQYPSRRALRIVCLMDSVVDELGERLSRDEGDGPIESLYEVGFRQQLFLDTPSDENFRLTARALTPEQATRVANTWARIVVEHLRELYGVTQRDLDELQVQIAEAREAFMEIESRRLTLLEQGDDASDDVVNQLAEANLDLDAARRTLDVLETRLAEMRMRFNESHHVVRILERAVDPLIPAGPSPAITIVLTTFAGGIVGLILALVRGPRRREPAASAPT